MSRQSVPIDFTKQYDLSALQGRAALVTGGASGIGAGVVKALGEAGAYVVIADIDQEAGEKYSYDLDATGCKTIFVKTDVTDWTSQVNAFKKAQEFSPNSVVDIVIAGAGIAGTSITQVPPFTGDNSGDPMPPTSFVDMINVNLTGVLYTATLAAYYWNLQGPPKPEQDNVLIVVASNIAYCPMPGFVGYSASKMGARGLWKSLRDTIQFKTSCRTNLLAPHIVRSPMTVDAQPILDGAGIKVVEISECVDCLLRFCCDREIRGRAVQVNPGKAFDLHDNLNDMDGAKAFKEHWEKDTRLVWDLFDESRQMSMS
ncbi:hypothetical protein AC579_1706 [Pseudocercospora musae]|uniref:Uncharacterized protein n=1 Tax=Pseudocercospora musae TaxID=113226 RepID=A0A139ICG2_9PEZI|nr:hypothetical protein AC579_1706 [Pseudocercospora musae]